MSIIDAVIVLIYLAAMMVIGFFVGKGNKSQEDYFLAGRSMPWLPVALHLRHRPHVLPSEGFFRL